MELVKLGFEKLYKVSLLDWFLMLNQESQTEFLGCHRHKFVEYFQDMLSNSQKFECQEKKH